ncbi:UNVERIFIED_CONTAM: hypothetical protein GTU68_042770 [Idotea baltica]|nr:hypothetical protein [Idotea baltica]
MPFNYAFEVKDEYSGNDFSHNTDSDGHVTKGEYRVLLPDGRTQIVSYVADHEDGYQAEVTYEGEASYDQPQPSYARPQPSYEQPKPQPTYQQPKPQPPVYQPPQQTYQQPQQTYQQPQEPEQSYQQPQNTYGAPF